MADQREAILKRLLEISANVEGVRFVGRNVTEANEQKHPAVYVLEGDEEGDENDPPGRTTLAPRRVHMIPQVVIVRLQASEAIGEDLNTLRARMIKAVLSDEPLRAMTANGRGIRYDGMETDLALRRSMIGQMALRFRITYLLLPETL